jgi:hypothetical protein
MSATSEVPGALDRERNLRATNSAHDVGADVKERLRKQIAVALATAAIGVAIVGCSAFIFLARVQIAAAFLGARVLFGMPVADIDAVKVLAVTIGAFAGMAHGGLVAVVGCAVALTAYLRHRPI